MQKLAEHIIAVANEKNKDVTNLQLQKIMFIVFGFHMRRLNDIDDLARQLYEEAKFSKWKYGPVVQSVYYKYNGYGPRPIIEPYAREDEDFEHLNSYITKMLDMDVFYLVNLTHELPSWADYQEEILEGKYVEDYTLEEIFEDFMDE